MARNRNKLHFVRGTCELEKGIVKFIGGMNGVSHAQTWYHVIYAIKDKFKEIDFWIDPQLDECFTLPSTYNHLRYGICKSFKCTYEPFPEGVVKPKRKLTSIDKAKYKENRDKAILGVDVETVLQLPTFTLVTEDAVLDINTSVEEINEILNSIVTSSHLPIDYENKLRTIGNHLDNVRLKLSLSTLDESYLNNLEEKHKYIHSELVKLISKIDLQSHGMDWIVLTSQTCSNCWNIIKILNNLG